MGSPVLWGPNNYATQLQNAEITATGALLAYNGPKNYITYGNFENQLTTGWSLGTIGTLTNGLPTGSPTFGSGASGNLSIAIVTSGQLAGTASLSYVSSAATTAGNMLASQAYTIDAEDQAKVLGFKFSYSGITNPGNANWSGTSSNSFGVAVYDVTNSVFLGVAGAFNIVQSSGTGIATGTFQTGATTASIRFIVYNVNATSGAITLYFDSFQVGPQVTMQAPAMSDWISYTPTYTGFGTVTNNAAYWRRVGDTVEVIAAVTCGTPSATAISITLPVGSIDTSKLQTASNGQICGEAVGIPSTSTALYSGNAADFVFFDGSDTTHLYVAVSGGTVANTLTKLNGNGGNTPSGTRFEMKFQVPIAGWSSNSVSSSDTDTRVISAQAGCSTSFAYSLTTPINFDTVIVDRSGAITTSATAWKFIAPVSGDYRVSTNLINGTGAVSTYVYKNGTQLRTLMSVTTAAVTSASTTITLNANDYIDIRGGSATLTGGSAVNTISIERLSGPAVITATESVNAAYGNGAGTSITSTSTVVPWPTKVFDSHAAMNVNGTYTVPVSGKYSVSATLLTASTAFAVANNLQLYLYKNGSSVNTLGYNYILGTTRAWVTGNAMISCNAGDTIQVYMNVGSGSTTLSNSVTDNFIAIARVGN